MSNTESDPIQKPTRLENPLVAMKIHDLIAKVNSEDESDFRPIKVGKEVDEMSAETAVIQPGERYYAGGTVSRVAGKDGVSAPSPMNAAEYAPETGAQSPKSTETEWVVIDGEMREVPKKRVHHGGTAS
jgi:hypothetical protein